MAKLPKGAKLSAIRREERAKRLAARERFKIAKSASRTYARQLSGVAKQVGHIIEGLAPDADAIGRSLRSYAELLGPWAQSVAAKQVAEADQRDKRAWAGLAGEMGQELRAELPRTEFAALMAEQVTLIKSLPLKAAQRVYFLVEQAMLEGRRASEVAAEILRTGQVTKSRALLIARTETSRVASVLCETRAKSVGSEGYVWRSSGDGDVRALHKHLEGTYHRWDDPPVAGENGERAHPGGIYNCFPGSIKVSLSTGLKKLWRVPYDGKLVSFKVGGQLVSATFNHPVLTSRGWLAAGLLKEHDQILCMSLQQGQVIKYDEDNMLPSFKEVFDALRPSLSQVSAQAFEFNLHGDVLKSDVDEVTVDLFLATDAEAIDTEKLREFILTKPDSGVICSKGLEVSSALSSGSCYIRFVLFWCPRSSHKLVCLDLGPSRHGLTAEDIANRCRCAAELGCQSRSAHSCFIQDHKLGLANVAPSIVGASFIKANFDAATLDSLAKGVSAATNSGSRVFDKGTFRYEFDSVSKVSFREFSGHVYTLESNCGWFGVTPKHIIAKNCRCYPEPVLPDVIN